MLNRILKGIAPVVAMAFALGTAACDSTISIGGEEGKPLAELDLAGKTPTGVVLAGPDTVIVTRGDALTINVEGDPQAVGAVRFTLDGDTLGVLRPGRSSDRDSKATVRVTLPALSKLTVAGSGTIEAASLSGSPEAVIAGSGTARVAALDVESLDVTIAGSGTFSAAGRTRKLDLTVAGSGSADMAALQVEQADVSIAGSGDAAFASDGTVTASVMGSGDVTVTGTAKCTIKSMGSGTLRCNPGGTGAADAAATPPTPGASSTGAPPAPDAPTAPEAPGTPDAPPA